jgi:glycosyltransferase involved in cell wall biosynthesis
MLKIAALTSGRFDPASKFRIRQYIPSLNLTGMEVREYCPLINIYSKIPFLPKNFKVTRYNLLLYTIWQGVKLSTRISHITGTWANNITWVLRFLVPGHLSLEPLLKRPLVFDVDDSIWLLSPFAGHAAASVAKRSEVIIAGNDYIASWFEPYSRNVQILPTAVDTEKYCVGHRGDIGKKDRFVIGWIGSSSNLCYLGIIEQCLRDFLLNHRDSEFLIICDKPLDLDIFPRGQATYIKWSEDIEVESINRMDVGIMPLSDNDWTKGKCSYKMLQYMACGIPVIVSPVGMNKEILARETLGLAATSPSEWYEAFSFYYGNTSVARAHGKRGRNVAEQNYSRKVITKRLACIFKGLT